MQNKTDPIIKNPEKIEGEELSPMDPPDAMAPPALDKIDYEKLDPFLKELVDDHKGLVSQLDIFEKTLLSIMDEGITPEIKERIRNFYEFFDHEFIPHNRKEESQLFPKLKQKLLETGEHSTDGTQTPVDILLADHIEALQLAAVSFNLFGLITKLKDQNSKLVILDLAIEQGKALLELLRIHIFREDNIVFSLAQKLISKDEFKHLGTN